MSINKRRRIATKSSVYPTETVEHKCVENDNIIRVHINKGLLLPDVELHVSCAGNRHSIVVGLQDVLDALKKARLDNLIATKLIFDSITPETLFTQSEEVFQQVDIEPPIE